MNQSAITAASRPDTIKRLSLIFLFLAVVFLGAVGMISSCNSSSGESTAAAPQAAPVVPKIDSTDSLLNKLYDEKIQHMVNGDTSGKWPVKTDYPLRGAILPYKRILSFYGNLYSKQMGILGELPPAQMLAKLQKEVTNWQAADSAIEVIPALHYIAVTAQQYPGKGNKHRLRMPFHQIDSVINMAARINAIVFVDVQVGLSTFQEEIPELEKYLKMPQMHLGIDPEFSMKGGQAPGKVIGTVDAKDINYVSEYLAKLVKENNLPPKVLVVHRFTRNMVTNYKQIKTRPEVQIVMDMDGWGGPTLKYSSYQQYIHREPVQFTGFKLFYKNDVRNNTRLLTPKEVLALKPQPMYIQYQ
jgi:hypothetical protein